MDWENRIIDFLLELEPFFSEEYLLTLANKGIYNRAHKDLEKTKEQIAIKGLEEEKLLLDLGDGTSISIQNPVSNSSCSCPSLSICRHIMTGILYCKAYLEMNPPPLNKKQENLQTQSNQELTIKQVPIETENEEDLTNIKSLPELDDLQEAELKKLMGKKKYETILHKVGNQPNLNIQYDKVVTVSKENQFKIYFTRTQTIEHAVCSCKTKGLCEHKMYAIIGYLKQERGRNFEVENERYTWNESREQCVQELKKEIEQILDRGLANLTQPVINKIEILYIKAYHQQFYEVANELKYLSGELVLYFKGNVAFSNQKLMRALCRIYNRLCALECHKNSSEYLEELMGQLRLEEIEEEELSLIHLGTRVFVTKRKDLVITAYFYCESYEKVLSMSTLRPINLQNTYYGMSEQDVIKTEAKKYLDILTAWKNEYNLKQITGQKIQLKHAIIKGEKLSSSYKSEAILISGVYVEDIKQLMIEDFSKIKANLIEEKTAYFKNYNEHQNIYLVKATDYVAMTYNTILQQLECSVYDIHGMEVLFYIPFNVLTEEKIKVFEKESTNTYLGFLGQFKLQQGRLVAELYEAYMRS